MCTPLSHHIPARLTNQSIRKRREAEGRRLHSQSQPQHFFVPPPSLESRLAGASERGGAVKRKQSSRLASEQRRRLRAGKQ